MGKGILIRIAKSMAQMLFLDVHISSNWERDSKLQGRMLERI
ncbi:hypothetical protein EYZ11_002390 [Aspergillus tanneri]|uniref:Uncharacterized protein n=1 Tax=Aspergillus tanneri TaxID=1220188 RepID=A0A4S3JQY1_9EURO|nr:hypothetical protein EYZ11_002390 [Aspergillus tanneri]